MISSEIFVLNYNGRDILAQCLPSILEAARTASCPVTVIDNRSTDDSVSFLEKDFSSVRVHVTEKNTVLCAFNEAVQKSRAEIVLLLNNDLKADKDFVQPLLRVFERHRNAFLAGPKTYTFDGQRYEGCLAKMYFRYGFFGAQTRFPRVETKIEKENVTMQSGFGAYRRDYFLELGGFDELYLPGTVEDSDICFRAWKSGYRCYYEPESRMYHKGQATFGRHFSRSRLLAINQRNVYLFIWKNISDPALLLEHAFWLFVRPILFLLRGRFEFLWGLLWALGRFPQALKKRFALPRAKWRLSDRQVFDISDGI
jgi:GT2 family glycosyltransferase